MMLAMTDNRLHGYYKEAGRNIADLAKNVRSITSKDNGMRRLAPTFQNPGQFDVICARGKRALNHPGNRRFRAMIDSNLQKYSEATTKFEKSLIVSSIVDAVRNSSPDGGFIKEEDGQWYEVGDHIAREKCGQSFRDLLHTKYRSSTKAKTHRRKNMQEKMGSVVAELVKSNDNVAGKMEKLAAKSSSACQDVPVSDDRMKTLFNEANLELLQQIKCTSPQLNGVKLASQKGGHLYHQEHRVSAFQPEFPRIQMSSYKQENTVDAEPLRLEDAIGSSSTNPATLAMYHHHSTYDASIRPPPLEERISASIFDSAIPAPVEQAHDQLPAYHHNEHYHMRSNLKSSNSVTDEEHRKTIMYDV